MDSLRRRASPAGIPLQVDHRPRLSHGRTHTGFASRAFGSRKLQDGHQHRNRKVEALDSSARGIANSHGSDCENCAKGAGRRRSSLHLDPLRGRRLEKAGLPRHRHLRLLPLARCRSTPKYARWHARRERGNTGNRRRPRGAPSAGSFSTFPRYLTECLLSDIAENAA